MTISNVLLVGVDQGMANSISRTFFDETFNAVVVNDVAAAWEALHEEEITDLVFLGPALDSKVKLDFCRRLKSDARTELVPVIFATLLSSESEEVQGFEAGVDDVVVMPRSDRLIAERMKAHIRRRRHLQNAKNTIQRNAARLERDSMRLTVGGLEFQLTPTESRILWMLMDKDGRPVTRRELLEACGGNAWGLLERTIDGHIKVLRKKLGDWSPLIETVWGLGYRIGDIGSSA